MLYSPQSLKYALYYSIGKLSIWCFTRIFHFEQTEQKTNVHIGIELSYLILCWLSAMGIWLLICMTLLKRTAKRSRLLINYFQIDVSPPCGFVWKFALKVKVNDGLTRPEQWQRSRMTFCIHIPQQHQSILWKAKTLGLGASEINLTMCFTDPQRIGSKNSRDTGNYHLLYVLLLGSRGKGKWQTNITAVL